MVAVEAQSYEVHAPHPHRSVEDPALGQIAYPGAGLPRGQPQDSHLSLGGWHKPQDDFEQDCLAHPIGTEQGGEFPTRHGETHVLPDDSFAETSACLLNSTAKPCEGARSGHLPVAWARAAWIRVSWATCQSWKVAVAGFNVSVIATTGIPAAWASAT